LIRYLKHNQIDKQAWDNCITKSHNGLAYAYSWYLDIVSPDWDALVEDDYTALFPLTWRKKAGIKYLFQPYFTQQLGLFSVLDEITKAQLEEFIVSIPPEFKLIEIQINSENKIDELPGYQINQRRTHHLSLSHSYEKISDGYSDNLKRNIKKADKNCLAIVLNVSPVEIIDLFRKNKGVEIGNLKEKDYVTLFDLLDVAKGRNLIDCRGVLNTSKELIAGAIFLKSVHSFIFLFSATSQEGKDIGSMSFIIDSFIRENSNQTNYLDFEGSMNDNLARYYRSFGSREVVYLQLRKNNLPFLFRLLKK
jgi:hypothetical protein